ncbi:MAG: phosphotransferase family protein [Steroidobacteraceae bacterium]
MSVFADHDRLLRALARTLNQRISPSLADPSARFAAQAAMEMLIYLLHRRTGAGVGPDLPAAQSMAAEIRTLTKGSVDAGAATRLTQILHEDSRFYRDDDAAYRARLGEEAAVQSEVFDPPTDAELTAILRGFTDDRGVEAKMTGRAVGGYSKQTVFFDELKHGTVARQFVMRRDLPFAASDRTSVTLEYPVLKALYGRGFAVAQPFFVEADPTVLKTPFLVSARVPGRLYGNSLGLMEKVDFDPEALLGKLLAQLHSIDVDSLAVPELAAHQSGVAEQEARIDRWIDIYRRDIDVPSAALEIGLAWLRANAHLVADRQAIVHGDVGYHNLLIHEGKASALVDWELVHVGSPVEDVAYVSSYIGDLPALIEHYVANGGVRPSEGAMTYCRIFGDVRNSIYGVVSMRQFNRGDHEDVSVLPIVLSSYSRYIAKLDEELAAVIAANGFRWRE